MTQIVGIESRVFVRRVGTTGEYLRDHWFKVSIAEVVSDVCGGGGEEHGIHHENRLTNSKLLLRKEEFKVLFLAYYNTHNQHKYTLKIQIQ